MSVAIGNVSHMRSISEVLARLETATGGGDTHNTRRGCTAPGCDVPGYLSEVHHVDEWADGGLTNVDTLTFACGAHHRLITCGGWKTRKRSDGTTEWLPPPHLPLPGRTNTFHHPERMLPGDGKLPSRRITPQLLSAAVRG